MGAVIAVLVLVACVALAGYLQLAKGRAEDAEESTGGADWYPDPLGQARLRYWDGAQWTEHTAA